MLQNNYQSISIDYLQNIQSITIKTTESVYKINPKAEKEPQEYHLMMTKLITNDMITT